MSGSRVGLVDNWLRHIAVIRDKHRGLLDAVEPSVRADFLCEQCAEPGRPCCAKYCHRGCMGFGSRALCPWLGIWPPQRRIEGPFGHSECDNRCGCTVRPGCGSGLRPLGWLLQRCHCVTSACDRLSISRNTFEQAMSLGLIYGFGVGALLGLTGAGGGILAIPALVLGLGFDPRAAVPVALLAVGISASIGAVDGLRRKIVRWRAGLVMGVAGLVATPIGSRMAKELPAHVLLTMFAIVMLYVAGRLLLPRGTPTSLRLWMRHWLQLRSRTACSILPTADSVGPIAVPQRLQVSGQLADS